MPKTIWRYKMKNHEQRLWNDEKMGGWRKAFESCVEEDARDEGMKKYMILDRKGEVVAKDKVEPLPVIEEELVEVQH